VSTYLDKLFSKNSVSAVSGKDCGAKVQGRNSMEVSAAVKGDDSANPGACDGSEGGATNAGILIPSEGTRTKIGVPAEAESGTYDDP
jgi:hypothetical protein